MFVIIKTNVRLFLTINILTMENNQKVKESVSFDTSINDRFLEFFKKNNLNYSEVSRLTKISDVTFGHIKNYRNLPSISTLLTMLDVFEGKRMDYPFSVEYVLLNKMPFNLVEILSQLEHVQSELITTKAELIEAKEERSSLIKVLGKDEGETDAYLVDTEVGFKLMNLMTIIQQGGFALGERNN